LPAAALAAEARATEHQELVELEVWMDLMVPMAL
jgi:hypothetical protein